jgi:hypothetical protein
LLPFFTFLIYSWVWQQNSYFLCPPPLLDFGGLFREDFFPQKYPLEALLELNQNLLDAKFNVSGIDAIDKGLLAWKPIVEDISINSTENGKLVSLIYECDSISARLQSAATKFNVSIGNPRKYAEGRVKRLISSLDTEPLDCSVCLMQTSLLFNELLSEFDVLSNEAMHVGMLLGTLNSTLPSLLKTLMTVLQDNKKNDWSIWENLWSIFRFGKARDSYQHQLQTIIKSQETLGFLRDTLKFYRTEIDNLNKKTKEIKISDPKKRAKKVEIIESLRRLFP